MVPHGSPWLPKPPHGWPQLVGQLHEAPCHFTLLTSLALGQLLLDLRAPTKAIFIWGWVNTYRYIFSGMNIHLPAILMWTTGVQGFDALPYECYTNHEPCAILSVVVFFYKFFQWKQLGFFVRPQKKTLKKSCHVPLFYLDSTSKLWGLPTFPTGSPPQSWRWSEGVGSAPLATAGGCCSCCPLRWWPPRADLLRWTVMGKLRENHGKTMGKWGSNKLVSPWII